MRIQLGSRYQTCPGSFVPGYRSIIRILSDRVGECFEAVRVSCTIPYVQKVEVEQTANFTGESPG